MAKTMLGCSGFFCFPSLVSGPCCNPVVFGLSILLYWGAELMLCVGTGKDRVNPARQSEGKESPFPFACPHPAARSCLGCTCAALGAVDVSSAVLGGIIWKGGEGAVLGSALGEKLGVLPAVLCPHCD